MVALKKPGPHFCALKALPPISQFAKTNCNLGEQSAGSLNFGPMIVVEVLTKLVLEDEDEDQDEDDFFIAAHGEFLIIMIISGVSIFEPSRRMMLTTAKSWILFYLW